MKLFDTTVWIGAGAASESEEVLALTKRLVLIEMQLKRCDYLIGKFSDNPNVTIVNACISKDNLLCKFYYYNNLDLTSPLYASGLYNIYPGLRIQKSENVACESIEMIKDYLSISSRWQRLILDLPSPILGILSCLKTSGLSSLFSVIDVTYSPPDLYQNAASFAQVKSILSEMGFEEFEHTEVFPFQRASFKRLN